MIPCTSQCLIVATRSPRSYVFTYGMRYIRHSELNYDPEITSVRVPQVKNSQPWKLFSIFTNEKKIDSAALKPVSVR